LAAAGITELFFQTHQRSLDGALVHNQAKAFGDAFNQALGGQLLAADDRLLDEARHLRGDLVGPAWSTFGW
jgi:hypothetical protein